VSALIIGTAIALAAVAYVLVPLFGEDQPSAPRRSEPPRLPSDAEATDPRQTTAITALREIEFDRATGKLSAADYETLKARYTAEALATMRAAENVRLATEPNSPAGTPSVTTESADALAEEMILRYRRATTSCATCGPRPEPDAVYCSSCGRYLPGRCGACGAEVAQVGARFCASCGRSLAA
jgi:hypothetical protein